MLSWPWREGEEGLREGGGEEGEGLEREGGRGMDRERGEGGRDR